MQLRLLPKQKFESGSQSWLSTFAFFCYSYVVNFKQFVVSDCFCELRLGASRKHCTWRWDCHKGTISAIFVTLRYRNGRSSFVHLQN